MKKKVEKWFFSSFSAKQQIFHVKKPASKTGFSIVSLNSACRMERVHFILQKSRCPSAQRRKRNRAIFRKYSVRSHTHRTLDDLGWLLLVLSGEALRITFGAFSKKYKAKFNPLLARYL
jgi:hypothetical protein